MDVLAKPKPDKCDGDDYVRAAPKDVQVQLVLSFALGLFAFVGFCILRPRWTTLYAARKRHSDPRVALPILPDSFLGWMPALYKVTEEQVLASAGLDAFVFLSFFKMAVRLFSVMLFFAAVVLWPIHYKFLGDSNTPPTHDNDTASVLPSPVDPSAFYDFSVASHDHDESFDWKLGYLWAYLVFTWFFSLLTVYFMHFESFKVIKVRQDYLGSQSTITDRTFRLSNIPEDLRSEKKIKQFVENLEIGNVKGVTLCRDWSEVDALVAERTAKLRKLEEAWSVYLIQQPGSQSAPVQESQSNEVAVEDDMDGATADQGVQERRQLLANENLRNLIVERPRPKISLRFGFLGIRSKKTDAIDYYEEKLRRLDEKIQAARKKECRPTGLAFVTMDSIAACQMAIQALVDPRPGQLQTKPAPSPTDIVWKNTYAPIWRRRLQSFGLNFFILALTLLWAFPIASIASLLSICTIEKISPSFARLLEHNETIKALIQTGLPTLSVSLLNVAVPYLYDFLTNNQGMISQGDVELSVVSKNFFFTFFNLFLVFTVSGTATQFWTVLRDSINDTSKIMRVLARSIQGLSNFYLNFIMLQGLGLHPFRLLQVGSVSLFPIYRMGAKTPRDFAEIVRPTLFNYGYYLPTALLVFILCLVYSVLPRSHLVLLLGICYFGLGYFVYKYQLLYSMDQPQHATGGAWRIICQRIILGLVVFQIIMAGILVLYKAFTEAILVAPLLILTLWYSFYWQAQFTPLTRFIALRSINRAPPESAVENGPGEDVAIAWQQTRMARRMSTLDEDREKGLQFVNPSLVLPLEQPWIYKDPPPPLSAVPSSNVGSEARNGNGNGNTAGVTPPQNGGGSNSGSSSFSLGDTHVWRENGSENV